MSRFMVQTVRFRFLAVALLVIGAAEPGALAQPGDTGGGTIYYFHAGSSYSMWSMDSDGSNKTRLPCFGYFNIPSRDLHNGYRWFLSVGTITPEYYPDGISDLVGHPRGQSPD